MDFSEPENWARIRREAEEFAAEHVTRDVIEHERRNGDGVDRALTRKLGERGWIASGWPVDEGGAGLDPFEAAALWNALRKAGVPTAGPGTTMLPANAIRATGSAELKARVLPGVAAGEVLICLGYTEPAGGSDVFACATRSERDSDEWIVNGQKIFTTFAHLADYCFLLTRSQPGSVGPRGLTMLLVPLDTPGIEIRAVHTMGHERTNIVFYNDVRVADANRVGEAHEGFAVMRAALEAEQNVAPGSRTGWVADDALEFARTHRGPNGAALIADVLVRERLARMAMEAEVADLLDLRVAFLDAEGDKPGPVSALFGPESYVRASAAAIDIAGAAGMIDWTDPQSAVDGALDAHYRSAVATTIYGGSSEVLRSLIVENRLGFPRSRPRR
ncbi:MULTISPECIES: acyl-CoA dehydrogenase family protein [Mycobacterium]|uniref:Acyl-CoA dehydrogenase, N-terminal domain protein n=1 Tax=Mycobacterium intracellulare 1956 TaxID=1299331 RepID=X8CPZ6_MYCIT|nr:MULTISPECIES: acyl-CoA dehydrogenase family protein [Mycobacterium]EUA58462.1 acyl-CoA dehydrogenase, N-terminal domain protein [Mycobacterium intracellulare 1956]ASW84928.1 acyl-CoA dehydrogenase [Mycobacterium intracellulare]EUA26475.1 acyl-CoA dehydrogenase, N-terminal domain protein [Mycobacterium intracellulare]MCA2255218.1 acyl-CoA dehydrogenase family protein [Mycobacterium intracellulare]MCA2306563.1 acyl-CoA dehydrogenase family protein [Mycobacterium intracellulare]